MTYPTTKGQAVVTSKYGMRHIDGVGLHLHGGIDYAGVPEHSPIQILTSAKVVKAGKVSSLTSGYGNMIDLNVNGEILRFGHLSKMFVKEGEDVEKGKIIGLMGNTGQSYGAHLHFEHRSKSSFMDSATATFDPLKTGAPSLIAIGDKPVRLVADQNYSAFRKEVAGLDSQSSKIAQLYREQGRVSNPVVANVQKVNNMVVEKS
jgi:murein DD-endopeptidase MepM/ murein hydrolase activator NlpD